MEVLAMQYQPVRYVVTNTEKIVLVTHDYRYAQKLAQILHSFDDPKPFYIKISK